MTAPTPAPRPEPVVDADSRPFWEGIARGELRIQRCGDCGTHNYYPRYLCPRCYSDHMSWTVATGTGVVHSFTVSRRPAGPGFVTDVPYVVALIDLDEGVRMLSNIVDCDAGEVTIGAPVEAEIRPMGTGGQLLPVFRLVRDAR